MSDMAALFEKDPLSLTTTDIDEVIKFNREKRHLYNLGDTKAGTVKNKTPAALAKHAAGLGDLLDAPLKI